MARRSRETPRRESDKDRELENLLRNAFRAFKAQESPVRIKKSGSRRDTKA